MDLIFKCRCGNRGQVGAELAGKIVKCKQCACKLRIPGVPESRPQSESHAYGLRDEPALGPLPPRAVAPSAGGPPPVAWGGPERRKKGGLEGLRAFFENSPVENLGLRVGGVVLLILAVIVIGAVVRGGRRTSGRGLEGVAGSGDRNISLTDARRGFQSKLVRRNASQDPLDRPPPEVFKIVRFPSAIGQLAAYLTPDPGDEEKHPAIIWITGGDCNSIGNVWDHADPSNDQTARALREAGIIMMFPSLRGGNRNPGTREGFLGEVDDVLAATDFLAHRRFVNPRRIYLGGHSTGGTLVMLVAASSDKFRAVFSFGPVDDVSGYSNEYLPFDTSNPKEVALRSPGRWLHSIRSPTFVFEGTQWSGNLSALQAMSRASTNPLVHFHPVKGTNHFSVLDPVTRTIAAKILADRGPTTNIAFTDAELNRGSAR